MQIGDLQNDSNLKTVILTGKPFLPVMEQQGKGVIVNIASVSGLRFTGHVSIAYSASKAGLIQFGKVVAMQYARKGIRCNTVVPGQMHTPLVEVRLAGQRKGGDAAALIAERNARVPMGQMEIGRA